MILSSLLAFPAILLIAFACPRHSARLFGHGWDHPRRRRVRFAGFILLVLSLIVACADPDRARAVVNWIGVAGVETLLLSLILAATPPRRNHQNRGSAATAGSIDADRPRFER